MMARIILCSLPLSGALNSTITLGKSLRDHGHEVVFCGMADSETTVAPYGFETIAVFPDWFPKGFVKSWVTGGIERRSLSQHFRGLWDARRQILHNEKYVDFLIGGGHRQFGEAISSFAPDLILVDVGLHSYWALMAYSSGFRCAYYSHNLPVSEDPLVPPLNSGLQPGDGRLGRLRVRAAWHAFFARRWLRNKGLALLGFKDWVAQLRRLARSCEYPLERFNVRTELMPLLDLPMLVMCPEVFDFPEAGGKPGRHYVEASIDVERDEPDFPWEALDEGRRLIYCSLGSIAYSRSFLQTVIDAVASEPGWQLVATIGQSLAPEDFHGTDESMLLVHRAPQLGLLRRASVMINHAGSQTARECIYFGVPQISFPLFFDQPGIAARVQYHGLGARGDYKNATAAGVRALLTQVLGNERIKSRVAAMSRVFQEAEAGQWGAEVIASWLSSGPRVADSQAVVTLARLIERLTGHRSKTGFRAECESDAGGGELHTCSPHVVRTSSARAPGLRGLAAVRSLLRFRREWLPYLETLTLEYGPVAGVECPGFRAFLISDPDLIHRVLVSHRDNYLKAFGSRRSRRFFGEALQTSHGPSVTRKRRMLAPALSRGQIGHHAGIITTTTARMLDGWRAGEQVLVDRAFMQLALEIGIEIMFGTSPGEASARIAVPFEAAVTRLEDFLRPPMWVPTTRNRVFRRSMDQLDREIATLLRSLDGRAGHSLLASFSRAVDDRGRSLTDRDIRNELVSMLAAGHRTMASALMQIVRLVGDFPEVDKRLATEAETVLGGRPALKPDAGRLIFTEQVIKEALRLCPPAGVLVRIARRDDTLAGFRIPAGARVFISPWVMQHRPEFFDEPASFRPERWSVELEAALPPYAYFPFGAGPRRCIGQALAMLEMKLIVATCVQRVRFAPLQEFRSIEIWDAFPAQGGLMMRAWPRQPMPGELGVVTQGAGGSF